MHVSAHLLTVATLALLVLSLAESANIGTDTVVPAKSAQPKLTARPLPQTAPETPTRIVEYLSRHRVGYVAGHSTYPCNRTARARQV